MNRTKVLLKCLLLLQIKSAVPVTKSSNYHYKKSLILRYKIVPWALNIRSRPLNEYSEALNNRSKAVNDCSKSYE